MQVISKTYCSKCKATDLGLTPYCFRIDKKGFKIRYMNCLPCWRERQKQKYNKDKVRHRQYIYDSIARHKEKNRARGKLNYAVKKGIVIKPKNCEKCKQIPNKLEGHHIDYEKPLEVVWLCTACHNKI